MPLSFSKHPEASNMPLAEDDINISVPDCPSSSVPLPRLCPPPPLVPTADAGLSPPLTLDAQHLAQLQCGPTHLAQCTHNALCIRL